MSHQASKLQALVSNEKQTKKNTKFVAITSGKGGVGKSTFSSNLAFVLAKNGLKIGIFDADLGLANLDVMFGVAVKKNILHVLKGEARLRDVLIEVDKNLTLIPGDSGDEIFKYNISTIQQRFLEDGENQQEFDVIIIDTGAGIGEATKTFLKAVHQVVILTVPDPAAITDAYAMIKAASVFQKNLTMVINLVNNEKEAKSIFQKLQKVAAQHIENFSSNRLSYIGHLPLDENIAQLVKQRKLFSKEKPISKSTIALNNIAKNITISLEQNVHNDCAKGLGGLIKRLIGV